MAEQALKGVDIPELGEKHSGKVRDFYSLHGKRLLITTDRQSAFDVVLGAVPYKGAVLNLLSQFWFEKTRHILPNHMLAVPDPNAMVVRETDAIPVEVIVRGYLTGVTRTSPWHSYRQGERLIYGIEFPDGLQKNQRLPSPVITPTTHGGGKDGHDERLTKAEIVERSLVSESLYDSMEQAARSLFQFGAELCRERGLILVDTKYEFGLRDGELLLIDEVHTPDSSRFWNADTYEERFQRGEEPENFDKEFLRLWYAGQGYAGDGPPPPMPDELVSELSERYIAVYETITRQPFERFPYPIEERIRKHVLEATG